MTISLVNGVNPLQTTLLELGIVSGRVALLLRSAEIQPLFGRFVSNTSSVFTPSFLDLLLLQGASIAFTCACSALSGWMFATGLLPISVRICLFPYVFLYVFLYGRGVFATGRVHKYHVWLLHIAVDLVRSRTGPGLDMGPCCIGPRPDLGWT